VEIRVLIDTDAFCKLAISGLLSDALAILNVNTSQCGRLPALPYMLRKGALPRIYGAEACSGIVDFAMGVASITDPDPEWIDRLLQVPDIEVGEAQLFAFAAANSLMVITGDKRSLQALKNIDIYIDALAGRIVVLEALLLILCNQLGQDELRNRIGGIIESDKMLKICFSSENSDLRQGLESYYRDIVCSVQPLLLWDPQIREGT
jgi:hypothetical protein